MTTWKDIGQATASDKQLAKYRLWFMHFFHLRQTESEIISAWIKCDIRDQAISTCANRLTAGQDPSAKSRKLIANHVTDWTHEHTKPEISIQKPKYTKPESPKDDIAQPDDEYDIDSLTHEQIVRCLTMHNELEKKFWKNATITTIKMLIEEIKNESELLEKVIMDNLNKYQGYIACLVIAFIDKSQSFFLSLLNRVKSSDNYQIIISVIARLLPVNQYREIVKLSEDKLNALIEYLEWQNTPEFVWIKQELQRRLRNIEEKKANAKQAQLVRDKFPNFFVKK